MDLLFAAVLAFNQITYYRVKETSGPLAFCTVLHFHACGPACILVCVEVIVILSVYHKASFNLVY